MARPIRDIEGMLGYNSNGKEIQKELQALKEVDGLLKEEAISLREASDYLFSLYGMTISHVGLRKRLANGIYRKEN